MTVCIEDTARCVYGAAAVGPASDSGYRRHDIVSAVTVGYHHTQCRATLAVDDEASELVCSACALAYPVRRDIPVMLVDEARTIG